MQALGKFVGESRVYHAMSLYSALDETIMRNVTSYSQQANNQYLSHKCVRHNVKGKIWLGIRQHRDPRKRNAM
jgi:hypothetical protein